MSERLAAAVALIDEANASDPNTLEVDGVAQPKELAHARMMTEWVLRLDPQASEEQLLAARAHHLRRWVSPRSSAPEGRAGYLRWRTDLKRRHAEEVASLLCQVGYDDESVAVVQRIIRKEGLGSDRAVQVHEDALCLVFLQTQALDLAGQLGADKTLEVLRKTVRKMSGEGLAAARALPLPTAVQALLAEATV